MWSTEVTRMHVREELAPTSLTLHILTGLNYCHVQGYRTIVPFLPYSTAAVRSRLPKGIGAWLTHVCIRKCFQQLPNTEQSWRTAKPAAARRRHPENPEYTNRTARTRKRGRAYNSDEASSNYAVLHIRCSCLTPLMRLCWCCRGVESNAKVSGH